ncbi:hypothetical protein CTAYLR_006730 [Chrysophaeum taylorii]|uniref:GB1/RHD3-type G domain-containing protein n=1 Tax=Chrysophaeum taylorii TaxID=2483200 RepID=A0AAD7UAW1_9STRA|nr:hypothetical protein CTAYLR_006730 [Chrysophaeum taylorii]
MNGAGWENDYAGYPAKALPLIEVREGGGANGWSISTVAETLGVVSRIEERVCVVAVTGPYRSGKSSLLNWLRSGHESEGFAVGHEVERCTRGIWVWGRPLATRASDGRRIAVLLVDTEGFGGLGDVDDAYDATIFTLASLLASTLIYNSLGTLDERAIASLGFCANLSRRVRLSSGDEEFETRQALARTMPRFVWVLRDFALELSDEAGQAQTSDEYLEKSLRPNGKRESDATREAIVSYFPTRACWCLPRPFSSSNDMSSSRPEFWEKFQKFREFVLMSCEAKLVEGAAIRGSTLAALAQSYAKAFQESEVPAITSAWRGAVETELREAKRQALEAHARSLVDDDDDDDEESIGALAARRVRGCRLADDVVRKSVVGGVSPSLTDAIEAAVRETREDCDAAFDRHKEDLDARRAARLKGALAGLEAQVLAPAIEKTRQVFALAEDPLPEGAYHDLDEAEVTIRRNLDRVALKKRSRDHLLAYVCHFAIAASFEAAKAVSETQHDRREAHLALIEVQKRDLEARVAFLEGKDKVLRETVDEQLKTSHSHHQETLALKARVDALETALRAERSRVAEATKAAEAARDELADAISALDNEERWQRQLQERLDMRIKLAQEREGELTRKLAKAERKRRYTVLDFLLDEPDVAAERLDLDATKLESFLNDINLPDILPTLKHLGAARVSDLVYLEPGDLDDIPDMDVLQKRRLMDAVDSAKAQYQVDDVARGPGCLLS